MKRKVLACLLAAMCLTSVAGMAKTEYRYVAEPLYSGVAAQTESGFVTATTDTTDTTGNALDDLTGNTDAETTTDETTTDGTTTDVTTTDGTTTDGTTTDGTTTEGTTTDGTTTDVTTTDDTTTDGTTTDGTTTDGTATDVTTTDDGTAAETVSEGIELEDDMASMSSVILARMIADYDGLTAYDKESGEGELTFWTEMSYLVTAYGTNNEKISYDEETGVYTLKKAQLRYYAASLYSSLGKAKKLPAIDKDSSEVTKKGGKWKFNTENIGDYDISIVSCSRENDEGISTIVAHLVNKDDSTSLGKYAVKITKSPYKGKKCPFYYSIVSIDKMSKMAMENILVGRGSDAGTTDTSATGALTDTTGTTTDSSSSYGNVLSMPGTTDTTATDATATDATATNTTATDATATDATATDPATVTGTTGDGTTATAEVMNGASISSDSAMKIAQNYYGTSLDDGTEYTYTYEGVATYMDTNYYNFSVNDSVGTVINILVSGDGARVFKGTNTNGTWTMQ